MVTPSPEFSVPFPSIDADWVVFTAAQVLPEAFFGLITPFFPGKTKLFPAAVGAGAPAVEMAIGLNTGDWDLVAIGGFGLLSYSTGLFFSLRRP